MAVQSDGTDIVNWLITGGTGFIGKEIITRILERSGDHLFLVVRKRADGTEPDDRIKRLLDELHYSDQRRRVHVIVGDCAQLDFQISGDDLDKLCRFPVRVLHMAANTNFSETLEQAREQNVGGTKNMLRIAQSLHARRALDVFTYVSTAYVGGHRNGTVYAYDLDTQAAFRNTYEQSKSEAEAFVRSHSNRLPTIIFRPSIVVGDSRTGRASGANTIYWAIKLYLRGQCTFFARRDSQLDLVPVDYVADAMLHILNKAKQRRHGQCYPLVAGQEKSVSLGELSKGVETYFGAPPARFLSPILLRMFKHVLPLVCTNKRHKIFVAQMQGYLPYFSRNPNFNDGPTRHVLAGSGISVAKFETYRDTLLAFCERAGWARKLAKAAHKRVRGDVQIREHLTQP